MAFFLDTYVNKPNLSLNGQIWVLFLCLKEKRVVPLPGTEVILWLQSLGDHERNSSNYDEETLLKVRMIFNKYHSLVIGFL